MFRLASSDPSSGLLVVATATSSPPFCFRLSFRVSHESESKPMALQNNTPMLTAYESLIWPRQNDRRMISQEHGFCFWLAEARMLDNDKREVELLLSSKKRMDVASDNSDFGVEDEQVIELLVLVLDLGSILTIV